MENAENGEPLRLVINEGINLQKITSKARHYRLGTFDTHTHINTLAKEPKFIDSPADLLLLTSKVWEALVTKLT